MPIERNINEDDTALEIWELIKKAAKPAPRFTGPSGPGGEGGGSGGGGTIVGSPMTDPGDLIVGGTAGAPTVLHVGDNGDVLMLVDGRPQWVTPGGSGGSPGALSGRYRGLVFAEDGAGGFVMVTATIGGQTWPVSALYELE